MIARAFSLDSQPLQPNLNSFNHPPSALALAKVGHTLSDLRRRRGVSVKAGGSVVGATGVESESEFRAGSRFCASCCVDALRVKACQEWSARVREVSQEDMPPFVIPS